MHGISPMMMMMMIVAVTAAASLSFQASETLCLFC
jgi:hypothetical protein